MAGYPALARPDNQAAPLPGADCDGSDCLAPVAPVGEYPKRQKIVARLKASRYEQTISYYVVHGLRTTLVPAIHRRIEVGQLLAGFPCHRIGKGPFRVASD